MKRRLFMAADRLLTWLETRLYHDNYYEADAERTRLKSQVERLQEEIEYLREACIHAGAKYYVRY